MKIKVKVVARAKKNAVEGTADGLIVRTTTVATDGKANAAVIKMLSKHLKIAQNKIKIVQGLTSRHKVIEIG